MLTQINRYGRAAILIGLFLVASWTPNPAGSSDATKGAPRTLKSSATSSLPGLAGKGIRPGIRLATPLQGCKTKQSGCELMVVNVDAQLPQFRVPDTMRISVFGGTPPYSFRAVDPNGNPVTVYPAGSDQSGNTFAVFLATTAGDYNVTVTDSVGCTVPCVGDLVPCCSLTQSEWGKKKPKFNGEKRPKTISGQFHFLGAGPLVVGSPGSRSVTFLDDSAALCILGSLPSNGPPAALPVGFGDRAVDPGTCQTLPPDSSLFENGLLGQTIALSLNVRLDPNLPSAVICSNMVTRSVVAASGSGFGLLLGVPGNLLDASDPGEISSIPVSVIAAIAQGSSVELAGKFTSTEAPGTVARLLKLANLALAGESNLGGASIPDINTAAGSANNAFDGCKFLMRCTGPGSSPNLQIFFNPDPVAANTPRPCSTIVPSWFYRATLTEIAGVGISISKFTWDFYDNNGNYLFTQTNTASDFASFFSACGTGTSRIPPNGQLCGDLCIAFGDRRSSASVIMTFYGSDDNGRQVSFPSDRLLLLSPR
jgi:hypothetical protein